MIFGSDTKTASYNSWLLVFSIPVPQWKKELIYIPIFYPCYYSSRSLWWRYSNNLVQKFARLRHLETLFNPLQARARLFFLSCRHFYSALCLHLEKQHFLLLITLSVTDPHSFDPDPDPAFEAEYRSGSRSNPDPGF